nr:hypothetical protein BDOA9_0205820 [Bradyrhizobium sp. DOA9]
MADGGYAISAAFGIASDAGGLMLGADLAIGIVARLS